MDALYRMWNAHALLVCCDRRAMGDTDDSASSEESPRLLRTKSPKRSESFGQLKLRKTCGEILLSRYQKVSVNKYQYNFFFFFVIYEFLCPRFSCSSDGLLHLMDRWWGVVGVWCCVLYYNITHILIAFISRYIHPLVSCSYITCTC